MANHLEVRVANPVTDSRLRTSEKIVDHSDFVAQNHQAVDEVGADKASTASDQDALPLRGSQKLYGREAGEGGIRDRVRLGVVDRLGLEERELVLIGVGLDGGLLGFGSGRRVVWAHIERAQDIEGDLAVKPEALEAYGADLLAILV